MSIKAVLLVASCALSLNSIAGTMGPVAGYHPWSVIGGLGYTWYNSGYDGGPTADPTAQNAIGDGQTAFGRLAIARDIGAFKRLRLDLEVGVQSGNPMRLNISQATLDVLGGLPIQTTIKPMLDLLASATTDTLANTPAFGVLKAGIAYRRMQVNDRVTVNDLSQAAFEVQAGLGMNISEQTSLALMYQGVFDGDTHFTVNTVNGTGHISNIPYQNGVILTISYKV